MNPKRRIQKPPPPATMKIKIQLLELEFEDVDDATAAAVLRGIAEGIAHSNAPTTPKDPK